MIYGKIYYLIWLDGHIMEYCVWQYFTLVLCPVTWRCLRYREDDIWIIYY